MENSYILRQKIINAYQEAKQHWHLMSTDKLLSNWEEVSSYNLVMNNLSKFCSDKDTVNYFLKFKNPLKVIAERFFCENIIYDKYDYLYNEICEELDEQDCLNDYSLI